MTELGVTAHTVLTATTPFDLACSLRALARFMPCAGDQFVLDGRIRKAFLHPTDPARAVVTEVVGRDDGVPGVELTVHSDEPLAPDELAAVGDRITEWLGLADDRAGFLVAARADPAMGRVLGVAEGLHQVRFPSLAEGATYFTMLQHSAQWFATARKRRLAADLGPIGIVGGTAYLTFPSLPTVLGLGRRALVRYAGSPQRAERLETVLSGIAALDEQWLRTGPYPDVLAALLAIKGVGSFTAHALLLRVLGRPDAVPLELAQFTKTAVDLYGAPAPSPAELRDWYGPWIGWWAYTCRTALGWLEQEEKAKARATRSKPRSASLRRRAATAEPTAAAAAVAVPGPAAADAGPREEAAVN
jgi:DNA-3-methyladenine glycosylase II